MVTMPSVHSSTFPRWRRLAMTGPNNVNYVHGRYTRRRRAIEHQLERVMGELRPSRLIERIVRLTPDVRGRAQLMLGWITGDAHPEQWALADPRPGRPSRWYVPRCALAFAGAWLRKARALQRLIFFDAGSISSLMPRLYKEGGSRGQNSPRRSPADEVRRLQAWSRAHGVAWSTTTEPQEP